MLHAPRSFVKTPFKGLKNHFASNIKPQTLDVPTHFVRFKRFIFQAKRHFLKTRTSVTKPRASGCSTLMWVSPLLLSQIYTVVFCYIVFYRPLFQHETLKRAKWTDEHNYIFYCDRYPSRNTILKYSAKLMPALRHKMILLTCCRRNTLTMVLRRPYRQAVPGLRIVT
jgi:hypothetical protein